MAVLGSPAAAQQANLPAEVWSAIAEMGPTLNQEVIRKSVALMKPLQAPRTGLSASQDVAYGPDPLQKMDLYQPQASAAGSAPIVIFVHGGGFTGGDKESGENIAAYFARHGLLGVTINYRLAPTVQWPEQSLDLGSVVAWLHANAARYGGDPRRIVVIAHSTGGAVESKNESKLPFLIVAAEFDPPRIAADGHQFAAAVCDPPRDRRSDREEAADKRRASLGRSLRRQTGGNGLFTAAPRSRTR